MIPLDELLAHNNDLMPAVLSRFQADQAALNRRYPNLFSPHRKAAFEQFYSEWWGALDQLPFESFTRSDRLDWLLFRNLLTSIQQQNARLEQEQAEIADLVPFAAALTALDDVRRDHKDLEGHAAAKVLEAAYKAIPTSAEGVRPTLALRAAKVTEGIRKTLANWWEFYGQFDPQVRWWCRTSFEALDKALIEWETKLRPADSGAIVGDPVGPDSLLQLLHAALIPYTPEELIEKADADRKWCLAELEKAAQELGVPNGRAAIEEVKNRHVAPGEQPRLVRDLAREAIAFVEDNDLMTVPELARDGWRMMMMTAERQKTNPFFLGGETIIVSFPAEEMDLSAKEMSLRGNNRHFSRATVHHELIPGHYMQSFFEERYRPYRQQFWTAFWVEGWTLHWEFLLWEKGFPKSPEDKVGMLFWRLHRAARVLFSLRFHLGEWTPEQCIALLTDEVGHEPANAEAEVRRSFNGAYDPLYQLAYLIGGMQVHALHKEALGAGWTDRQFHDAFLRENLMPIPALRAYLLGLPLEKDTDLLWQF